MECVRIDVQPAYDVKIGAGLLTHAGEEIRKVFPVGKALIVTESRVAPLYLDTLKKSLADQKIPTDVWIFPAGEESKNWKVLGELLPYMMEKQMTRSDYLIALGGGVTGDLTGFAASIYQRGIPFVQIPTTLLAAVDSSVGGKTAVNLPGGKNQAGTFWQPSLVLMDPDVLQTLPEDVYKAGMAESIKYGILRDSNLFDAIARGELDQTCESSSVQGMESNKLEKLIAECIAMKEKYVREDERDRGVRQFLNLGHTFAHGIEAESGWRISHGYAVAMGICIAAAIGDRIYSPTASEDGTMEAIIHRVFTKLGLPTSCPYTAKQIMAHIGSDKKRKGNHITLVIPRRIGSCELVDYEMDAIEELLNAISWLRRIPE